MTSIPAPVPVALPSTETIKERFRRLEAIWTFETGCVSSYEGIVSHPAFQEIIRMGLGVVPLMLQDLKERPRLWVWALPLITGVDPVPAPDRGNVAKMTEAWLRWAMDNGYQP